MPSRRVLIIDDDADVAALLGRIAGGSGFEPVIADEHRRFDTYLARSDPAVVITDLQMPDVDGVEVLRHLAASGSRAKVVLLSGFESRVVDSARRLAASLGLDIVGAFTKPVAVADLRALLTSLHEAAGDVDVERLLAAIDGGEMVLHYQPKIALCGPRRGTVTGVEALVRWQHPTLGLLAPHRFVPLAEQSGAIAPLTEATLAIAIGQAAAWRAAGLDLSMAVNIAPQVLDSLDFPDRLARRVAAAGLEPGGLVLEITETGAMEESSRLMDILTRLRLKGFALSIDDFGTGYSSLVQLHRMPFSELKIDKSFVMGLGQSREAEVIVRAVIELAHNLSLTVCAEGVETAGARDLLGALGCERAQGFLISRPVSAPDLLAWKARWDAAPAEETRSDASSTT